MKQLKLDAPISNITATDSVRVRYNFYKATILLPQTYVAYVEMASWTATMWTPLLRHSPMSYIL